MLCKELRNQVKSKMVFLIRYPVSNYVFSGIYPGGGRGGIKIGLKRRISGGFRLLNAVIPYTTKTYGYERYTTRTCHLQLRRLTLYPDELISQVSSYI